MGYPTTIRLSHQDSDATWRQVMDVAKRVDAGLPVLSVTGPHFVVTQETAWVALLEELNRIGQGIYQQPLLAQDDFDFNEVFLEFEPNEYSTRHLLGPRKGFTVQIGDAAAWQQLLDCLNAYALKRFKGPVFDPEDWNDEDL